MRKLYWILSLGLISPALAGQIALNGLYTPLHLQADTTEIILRDYLGDRPCQGIILPEGLVNHSAKLDTLRLTGNPSTKISSLGLQSAAGLEHLVLVAAEKTTSIKLRFKARDLPKGPLRVIGTFNDWNRQSQRLEKKWWQSAYEVSYQLTPGNYEYKLYVGGEERLDPSNPLTRANGLGDSNNVLVVPGADQVVGDLRFQADRGGLVVLHSAEAPSASLILWNNQELTVPCKKNQPPSCIVRIPEAAKKIERSYLRVFSYREDQKGADYLIPLHYGEVLSSPRQLRRQDWHQARLYFLMIDRFANGDPSNDHAVADSAIHPKANYQGGDLAGLRQKLQQGYFDSLGVNSLWLSPITQNPLDAWGYWDKGSVKSKFSGYHGYWPISNIRIDFRFGNEQILRGFLAEAHRKNYNAILDYVANHVHLQHPVYQENKDWATPLYLPDGTKNTEKWDEHRLTTWFDDHLPTLDLRRPEIVAPMVDSALVWLRDYDFDGFRHDATKHIDERYWRELSYRIRTEIQRPIYQIGETYGSPALINRYISTGMLDAQFDFNLYDAAVHSFATGEGIDHLLKTLQAGLATYGHHHLMGNISGNQDRSRFISLASGDLQFDEDQKLAGWERQIGKPKRTAYKRLALLHAFNYSLPGIPCLYYGDEIGLPGANDPDNRRMMRFAEDWDEDEKTLFKQVQKLNQLRAEHLPLIYGSTQAREVAPQLILVQRRYLGQELWVLFNLSKQSQRYRWETELPGLRRIWPKPKLSAEQREREADELLLAPLSYQIFTNY